MNTTLSTGSIHNNNNNTSSTTGLVDQMSLFINNTTAPQQSNPTGAEMMLNGVDHHHHHMISNDVWEFMNHSGANGNGSGGPNGVSTSSVDDDLMLGSAGDLLADAIFQTGGHFIDTSNGGNKCSVSAMDEINQLHDSLKQNVECFINNSNHQQQHQQMGMGNNGQQHKVKMNYVTHGGMIENGVFNSNNVLNGGVMSSNSKDKIHLSPSSSCSSQSSSISSSSNSSASPVSFSSAYSKMQNQQPQQMQQQQHHHHQILQQQMPASVSAEFKNANNSALNTNNSNNSSMIQVKEPTVDGKTY
jgi:hypothetical protein